MIESKLKALKAELIYYGYIVNNGQVTFVDGSISEPMSLFVSRLSSLQEEQIELLKEAWKKVETHFKALAGGISIHGLRVLQKAAIRLFRKSNTFVLKDKSVSIHLKKLCSLAADRMSHATAEQGAVVISVIELHEYNIKKIGYLKYLIKQYEDLSKNSNIKIATDVALNSSVQGPYSNLDLPVEERVFTWNDISEEVQGRQDLKQKQRRYRMGLEDNAPSDTKVGFYWRELRNEPYLMPAGTEEAGYESSYPYRANLWGNP